MTGMTGYSFIENINDGDYISTEIKTVNHRFLEVTTHLPTFLNPLELKIKELITQKIKRGKVDINVYMRLKKFASSIQANTEVAKQYASALQNLIKECNLVDNVTLTHLQHYQDILTIDNSHDYNAYWEVIKIQLEQNIVEVLSMKADEGASTYANIKEIITKIKADIENIEHLTPKMEKIIEKSYTQKIKELLQDNVDETRILMEVGILVSKSCINEEIKRFKHHLTFLEKILDEKKEEEIGKRVEFVCQELGREINTLGSKAVQPTISEYAINIKNNLEKIREQIRNIE